MEAAPQLAAVCAPLPARPQVAYVSGRATIGGDGDSGGGTLPAQLQEQ